MKHIFSSFASLVVATLLVASANAASFSAETIKNLNAAYRGEANANHRYALFAQKAEQEGYAQVARLFRATSKAEEIHRDKHKATILEAGGELAALTLDPVTVGTTAENLRAAITGESYERDTMYPGLLETAKAENAREAVRAFLFAVSAEKEHAVLYQQALDQLGHNPAADYYVCPVCGETSTQLPGEKCPVCRTLREKFIKIT
jgi:rubrerythrin